MKKLFAAILSAALLGLGLVGLTAGSASADCGYTTCQNTSALPSSKDVVKVGKKGKVKVAVVAAGNTKPVGTVKVTVRGPGGYKFVRTLPFNGANGATTVKTSKLTKKGTYTVVVKFSGPDNGIYDNDKSKDTFVVR